MNNVTITYISGDQFCMQEGVYVFLRSLMTHVSGEKIVFTHGLNEDNRAKIKGLGVTLLDTPFPVRTNIMFDRWETTYHFLCNTDFEKFLIVDSKDVVFQSDPFEHPLFQMKEFCLLVDEGHQHKHSLWNAQDQLAFQIKRHQNKNTNSPIEDFLSWPVINGGVIAGTRTYMKLLGTILYSGMYLVGAPLEQSLLNYMYHTAWYQDPRIYVAHPREDWFCATGEPVHWGTQDYKVQLVGGLITNPALERPFALVHQWERVALWKENILSQYN